MNYIYIYMTYMYIYIVLSIIYICVCVYHMCLDVTFQVLFSSCHSDCNPGPWDRKSGRFLTKNLLLLIHYCG